MDWQTRALAWLRSLKGTPLTDWERKFLTTRWPAGSGSLPDQQTIDIVLGWQPGSQYRIDETIRIMENWRGDIQTLVALEVRMRDHALALKREENNA